ncbi:MAG TPA: flagellar biosynthesis anti-sigma factor FlgM [Phycisphaerae bacterium]|nr:flagellar biosynthesis anti-sigma factor FlgM [Phycisphaerae bacterium]HRR87482.1 flagellar biosynthesis anti-sigma factor FlgM [Phycisphaerae bacterium]
MNDIPPIKATANPVGLRLPAVPDQAGDEEARQARTTAPVQADRVDISEMGQLLSTLDVGSQIRVDKVTEIREAIANGTYITDAKINYTVSRLMEELKANEEI